MKKLTKKQQIAFAIGEAGELNRQAQLHFSFARNAQTSEERIQHSQIGQYKAAQARGYLRLSDEIENK